MACQRGGTNWLGKLFVTFIGICQWIYAFILSICVVMAGGAVTRLSPEIEIDFSTRATALRTTFLLALIALSWFGCYSFMWRRRWAWYYTWILGIFLLGVGFYAHWTRRGALEAFLGQDSLRQTTGFCLRSVCLPCCRSRRYGGSFSRLTARCLTSISVNCRNRQ